MSMLVLLLFALTHHIDGHRLKPQAKAKMPELESSEEGCACDKSLSSGVAIEAFNFTRSFQYTGKKSKSSSRPYQGSGEFVNQSLYTMQLPGLASRWLAQQEICIGPDRPSSLEKSRRSSLPFGDFKDSRRQATLAESHTAFLNFIHGGLKKTSAGPMAALMTYALVTDSDGNGMLHLAEEGDHADVEKTIPQLLKYDGRDETKHSKLASGGNLLYAGQLFVDLGKEFRQQSPSWEDIESGDIAGMFPNAVVVIDDGSGTYTPPVMNLPTVACILKSYFPGIEVTPQHYLETPNTAGAENMALKFDIGNVVKGHQKYGFKTQELPFLYPYKLVFTVNSAHGPESDMQRGTKFPSSWGKVTSAKALASGWTTFSVSVDGQDEPILGTLDEGTGIITWTLEDSEWDTWEIAKPEVRRTTVGHQTVAVEEIAVKIRADRKSA